MKDIKATIVQLPRAQFERLAEWFDRQRETEFDRQIQADANSGRLDELYLRQRNPRHRCNRLLSVRFRVIPWFELRVLG